MNADSTTPLTEEELQAIERRERLASPGPWYTGDNPYYFDGVYTEKGVPPHGAHIVARANLHINRDANEDFIAGARQDIPRLLAEVRRLRARESLLVGIATAADLQGAKMKHAEGCGFHPLGAPCRCGLGDLESAICAFEDFDGKPLNPEE